MLVLSRFEGQRIVIGGSIIVEVTKIQHDKVRIGIIAPDDVPVHRQEVADVVGERSLARSQRPNRKR